MDVLELSGYCVGVSIWESLVEIPSLRGMSLDAKEARSRGFFPLRCRPPSLDLANAACPRLGLKNQDLGISRMPVDADQCVVPAIKVFQPPVFPGGIVSNSNKSLEVEQAPPRCFQILSLAEYALKVEEAQAAPNAPTRPTTPLSILADAQGRIGYPAFQLESWLDLDTFLKLRYLYLRSGASDNLLWDFLRTRHSDLGGTTGVDFLLGFFDPKTAAMSFEDRTDHFLDIAKEDILGATQ